MSPRVAEPLRELGAFLTGIEAEGIAARLAAGATLSQALIVVPAARRQRARSLLTAAGLGPQAREHSAAVLEAVAGAAGRTRKVTPVWTAPAGLLGSGTLTSDVFALVSGATTSVVCATFNLQPTSVLWKALVRLGRQRPGVAVRLYVDTQAADGLFEGVGAAPRRRSRLSTADMARALPEAVVLRTRAPEEGERPVTSHAKLLSVDHRFLPVGSANFSHSAEERNIELGLRLDDPALAVGVEKQMRDLEGTVYERVGP